MNSFFAKTLEFIWTITGVKKTLFKEIQEKYGKPIEPGLSQRIQKTTDEIVKLRKELEDFNKKIE